MSLLYDAYSPRGTSRKESIAFFSWKIFYSKKGFPPTRVLRESHWYGTEHGTDNKISHNMIRLEFTILLCDFLWPFKIYEYTLDLSRAA